MQLHLLSRRHWSRLLVSSLGWITLCHAALPHPHFHGEVSDRLIDVGNLNLFRAVWQRFYEEQKDVDIMSDRKYQTWGLGCNEKFDDPDQEINVVIRGSWGSMINHRDPDAKHVMNRWQMRDTLMEAMWSLVKRYAARNTYTVWTNCRGEYWNDFYTQVPNAACGNWEFPHLPRCECRHKNGRHWEATTQCMDVKPGHRLPASLSIRVYDERGELRADALTVEFHTSGLPVKDAHACGSPFGQLLGGLGEMVFNHVPAVGIIFDRALKLFCKGGDF